MRTSRSDRQSDIANFVRSYGFDGVDLEWSAPITAAQFTTIVTTVKTALGSKSVSASLSSDFWNLSGVNKGVCEPHSEAELHCLTYVPQ